MAMIGMRDVCWGFGEPPLLENVTFQIEKGERVCLVGRNGVGKSSLLQLLAGDMLPDSGDIWRRQGISVAVLEQDVLAGFDGTIFDVVAEGLGQSGLVPAEHSRIGSDPEIRNNSQPAKRRDGLQHMLDTDGGWELSTQVDNILSRTGLDPENRFADLSAGLKRRALFARALVRRPDLLLLVSHDRAFLNNVVTSTIVFEGNGQVVEYAGGYDDWLSQRPQPAAERLPEKKGRQKARPKPKARPSRKLGYMQQREMQDLPNKIEALESEQKELAAILSDPLFYQKEKDEIAGVKKDLDRVDHEIETAYRRWEELEALKSQADT